MVAAACNIVDPNAYGDCRNVTVQKGESPSLDVKSRISDSGIIRGATVHAGGVLEFSGIANGDILVKGGGRLILTGVVNG